MIKRFLIYLTVSFVPAFLLFTFCFYQYYLSIENRENNVEYWQGKNLSKYIFYDKEGQRTLIDYNATTFTVLNFWYVGCSYCIDAMEDYEDLLGKTKDHLKIYSISTDNNATWKAFVTDTATIRNKRLKFLAKPHPFWQHLSLGQVKSSNINFREIARKEFKVSRYPTYFILDKNGKIITVTNDLSMFIQIEINKKSGYLLFLKNLPSWHSKKKLGLTFIVLYPAGLLLLMFIIFIVRERKHTEQMIKS